MSLPWERDFVTEVEQGEEIAAALHSENRPNMEWFSNLRFRCMEAGYDQTVGCTHERGAFNDRAVAEHAKRGITIPTTWFCFDCGTVKEVPADLLTKSFRDIGCDHPVMLGGIDADGNHHEPVELNLSPARPDYVTTEGVEVWVVRDKGCRAKFIDADGNQVGKVRPSLAGAVVAARMAGWIDPTLPDWFNDAGAREVLPGALDQRQARVMTVLAPEVGEIETEVKS